MAAKTYGVNDAEAVKLWSRRLFRESLNQTYLMRFLGEGSDSMVQLVDDGLKSAGDRVRVTLRMQLGNEGVSGDSTLEGQEEAIVTHTDNVFIDQLRHATRSGGRMSEQRVPFSVRKEGMLGLQDWWADRFDTSLFNQLAGYTAQSDTKYTGLNSVTAPDSNHHVFASSSSDESLSSASTITLNMIDTLVEKAETLDVPMRPLMVGGEPYYVLFIHPYQAYDLRTNTTTGQWFDIQKAALQGDASRRNPIFTGALGVYNQVILHRAIRVPQGVNSSTSAAISTVRRAIFAGAQAGVMAFGRDNSPNQMTWVEKMFDYDNQLGISAGSVFGAKRTIFNSESFGSIVLSTYAAAH